jgi:hypothetical protein
MKRLLIALAAIFLGVLSIWPALAFFDSEPPRLMLVIDYNNDLSEIWQWLDEGSLPLHDAAESLKFGTNYLMYSFTH